MNRLVTVPLLIVILFSIDLYTYQAFRFAFINSGETAKRIVFISYWSITLLVICGILLYNFLSPDLMPRTYRTFLIVGVFINYFTKLFIIFFLVMDDVIRLTRWIAHGMAGFLNHPANGKVLSGSKAITRSDFLMKTALAAGSLPLITMGYGIISGAHDYRIRKKTIVLPDLPEAFNGFRIGQISDIHSGSLFNKKAVSGGVELLLNEKPDIIFFTGDLVNSVSSEMRGWMEVFEKIKAPLGVYSTLGNHDYGDYAAWPSLEAKRKNLALLVDIHRELGYDLLRNENRRIRIDGDEIALIGVENWGRGRFSKYGDLEKAYMGSEEVPVKLLLSHDPSHWDAKVRPDFPDIDVTFSGHTHGFQFGIEAGNIRWSPSQYFYKQWAGLYQEGDQYLYVNRGFGCLGYPGRIGIPPEITIIEFRSA